LYLNYSSFLHDLEHLYDPHIYPSRLTPTRPHVYTPQALGLSRLGYKLVPEWPLVQQLLFALGMMDTKYKYVQF